MKWLLYLRLALVIVDIIKSLSEGKKVDTKVMVTKLAPVLPEKVKTNLSQLTQEDIDGIQDAFLAIGDIVDKNTN